MHRHNFVLNAAKVLTLTLILTTTLMVVHASPAAANPANAGTVEQQILEFHNRERAARGIRPLSSDGRLQQKAREWAQRLAREGTIYHMDTLPARGFGFKAGGENIIYRAPSMTSNYAHIEWMESDLHRKNVLDPAFSHAGIGVTCATIGDRNYTVAVVEFGADSSPSTAVPPLEPRAVGGDRYAGTEVTCKGYAPLDLSVITDLLLPPPVTSGIAPAADSAPAPVAPKPKPKPQPVPVAVVAPSPVPPPPEPVAPPVVIPDIVLPEVLASAPIVVPARPVTSPAKPERLETTAAVDDRNEVAIWSGVLFGLSLAGWLGFGLISGRKARAGRPAPMAAVRSSAPPHTAKPQSYTGRTSLLDLTYTPATKGNLWRLKK